MSGCSRWKSSSSCAAKSPSRPTAQKRTTRLPTERRVQAAVLTAAAASPAITARRLIEPCARTLLITIAPSRARLLDHGLRQPATGEAGALQAAADVRISLHDRPDETAAVILDHRHDRPLVNAEIVARDPADVVDDLAVTQRHLGEREARVHRVEEPVLLIQMLAEARAEGANRRNHDLRREGDRADRGRRCDGAVIEQMRRR